MIQERSNEACQLHLSFNVSNSLNYIVSTDPPSVQSRMPFNHSERVLMYICRFCFYQFTSRSTLLWNVVKKLFYGNSSFTLCSRMFWKFGIQEFCPVIGNHYNIYNSFVNEVEKISIQPCFKISNKFA